jgi:hypothetical protein
VIERREKEYCVHCNGQVLVWKYNDTLKKMCVICGATVEAKRENDRKEFHEVVDNWQ